MNGRLAPTVGCKCYRFVTFRLPQNVTSVCVCAYIHRERVCVCVIYMFIYFSPKNSRWKSKCPTPGEPANASRVLIGCRSVPNSVQREHTLVPLVRRLRRRLAGSPGAIHNRQFQTDRNALICSRKRLYLRHNGCMRSAFGPFFSFYLPRLA